MTHLEFHCSDEKATALLKAARLYDEGVELQPVRHGRWVNPRMNKYGHPCHHCSECGFLASQKDRNFFPNCGAKMGGAEDD